MKKIIAVFLVLALLVCGALLAYAIAEAADSASAGRPLVDLTGALVAVVLVIFDFLLAWIAKVIVPPIKQWLESHTTAQQRGLLWDMIEKLRDAAEQTIRGPGQGEKRLAYVEAGLQERGFKIDTDMIEAAVKRMNDRLAATVGEAFGVGDDSDYDLPPLEDWPLEMIVDFCRLNGIPHTGCETKEEYIDAIVGAAKEPPSEAEVVTLGTASADFNSAGVSWACDSEGPVNMPETEE